MEFIKLTDGLLVNIGEGNIDAVDIRFGSHNYPEVRHRVLLKSGRTLYTDYEAVLKILRRANNYGDLVCQDIIPQS